MSKKISRAKGRISDLRNMRRMQRLALIKERYRSLILEPRRRLEMELDGGQPVEEHDDYVDSYEDQGLDVVEAIRGYYGEDADAY